MRWIYRLQQHVSLSAQECSVLLFLTGLLGAGLVYRYAADPSAVPVAALYAEADRLLAEGTELPDVAPATLTNTAEPAVPPDQPHRRAAVAAVLPPTYPLDLNRATAEDLETLPRVGPATAARILAYREEHGPFRRVSDLLNIKGIGEKTLARFDTLVTVAP